jgi:hypothetical protein
MMALNMPTVRNAPLNSFKANEISFLEDLNRFNIRKRVCPV